MGAYSSQRQLPLQRRQTLMRSPARLMREAESPDGAYRVGAAQEGVLKHHGSGLIMPSSDVWASKIALASSIEVHQPATPPFVLTIFMKAN